MIRFIILLLLTSNSYSYDATVKDSRGRIVNYLNQDEDKIYVLDLRGNREYYIEDSYIKYNDGTRLYEIEEYED